MNSHSSDGRLPLLRRVRYRITETPVRVPVVWLRHRGFGAADVFLTCYPKSGSTWLRFMVLEVLTGENSEFENVNCSIRPVGDHFQSPALLPGGGRFIGTHESYRAAYRKVVYLVRDIRDVVLSGFARERLMGIEWDLDQYLHKLMAGRKRHGSWHAHVLSYLDSGLAESGELLVVRFEDLRLRTEETLTSVIRFLGVRPEREGIRRAIENNSLQAMRVKEDRAHEQPRRILRRPYMGTGDDNRFVRKGAVGGWRGELTAEQIRYIEEHCGQTLLRLGYPLISGCELQPI